YRVLHAVELRHAALPAPRRGAGCARFLRQVDRIRVRARPGREARRQPVSRKGSHMPAAISLNAKLKAKSYFMSQPEARKFEVTCASCNLREVCLPGGLGSEDLERVQ